ncbi:hypothetical protein SAMD00019534_081160 [Acytostelium subglobosum LB1]|uniref:hypothetical protein n=1 Tax=Acytostelium subglobosum LB1 TaxID=1410327 RepID=UPI0006448D19|nr:hypothetical protein SAMD00019534_081160 [Acytostelium subglobosum LB1]GAM24941.1 hypothetical protein SAMD00019534_081160 [Acytostelium subglobosum LB1]|eukprot:XP_012752030.1 hypothetical protein SAMD00019534_081160 [Acytostelium subglobosum LB1]
MAKFDPSLIPLFIILGTAGAFTVGFGYRKMTTDNDISVTRKGQMLWASFDNPKLIERKTSTGFYNQIDKGLYLRK